MSKANQSGHRERLRERFINCEQGSRDDVALLELLLTYAIPLKDVQPLANSLLAEFGSFDAILAKDIESLSKVEGIKHYSAILINLVDAIRKKEAVTSLPEKQYGKSPLPKNIDQKSKTSGEIPEQIKIPRQRSGVFGKAILKEAIEILPKLPNTESLAEIRKFLFNNLHLIAARCKSP